MVARPSLIAPLLLLACARHRGEVVVDRIVFEGNGSAFTRWYTGTSHYNLRAVMEQKQSPALRPRRAVLLDRESLALDAWRIETWYAHHGYFDARFDSWEIIEKQRPGWFGYEGRRHVVIRGHLEQELPTQVVSVEWTGMDDIGAPLRALLKREAAMQRGARFNLDELRETEALTLERLHEWGYPYARVSGAADVQPDKHEATVLLSVDTGPSCRFGQVSIEGELPVDIALIRSQVDIQPDKPYRGSSLASVQRRLYGLGVFSMVDVQPILTDPPSAVVPVRIRVSPSKERQVRLGGGFLLESGRQDVHLSADYEHVNLFDRLVRLEFNNQVGYASLVTLAEVSEATTEGVEELAESVTAGPTAQSELKVIIPRVPLPDWRVETDLLFELGVEEGYKFFSPEFSPALIAQLSPHLSAGLSYRIQYFDYLELALDRVNLRRTPLGLDSSDPYLLSSIGQQVILDDRDDVLFTREGYYGIYDLTEAGGPFGGNYNFIRFTGDQRLYWPIRQIGQWYPRGTFGLRLGGGFIQPYGAEEEARVPYAERLYLGGSTSVRGWSENHLGPYICDPDAVDGPNVCTGAPGFDQPNDEIVPIGGLLSSYGGLELRVYHPADVGLALFYDAGMAWERFDQAALRTLQHSTGLGLRYRSPIGPVRLDVARRFGDEPMFSLEPRFGVHFSLSEAW